MIWKIRGKKISFHRTLLMGILNATPDSFSDGGKFLDPEKAFWQAQSLAAQGADLLDIGVESTRPGASEISEEEELERLRPILKRIIPQLDLPVSIDTTKPRVARECLKWGAHIINDVSGLKDSGPAMVEAVKEFGAGLIVMHRRGNPATMQSLAVYENVVAEICREISESLRRAEILDQEQIVLDPGLGFAKNAEQNLEILRHLEVFQQWGRPILLGPSRKSFIGKMTGRQVQEREFGTAAVCALAVSKGVQILRVHEVSAMRDVVRMAEAVSCHFERSEKTL